MLLKRYNVVLASIKQGMHTRETHPNDCIHSASDAMHSFRTTNPMFRHPFYNTLKCLINQIGNEIKGQNSYMDT